MANMRIEIFFLPHLQPYCPLLVELNVVKLINLDVESPNSLLVIFLSRSCWLFTAILEVLCSCSIFSDVAGDITIVVDGESFLLHKVNSYT